MLPVGLLLGQDELNPILVLGLVLVREQAGVPGYALHFVPLVIQGSDLLGVGSSEHKSRVGGMDGCVCPSFSSGEALLPHPAH